MKVVHIPIKTIKADGFAEGFKYSTLMEQVILNPGPGGLPTDQLIKGAAIYFDFKKKLAENPNGDWTWRITPEQKGYLLSQLDAMKWTPNQLTVDLIIAFINNVRESKEVDE